MSSPYSLCPVPGCAGQANPIICDQCAQAHIKSLAVPLYPLPHQPPLPPDKADPIEHGVCEFKMTCQWLCGNCSELTSPNKPCKCSRPQETSTGQTWRDRPPLL